MNDDNNHKSILIQQFLEGIKLFIGCILFVGLCILLLFIYTIYNETFNREKQRMERQQTESRAFLGSSTCTNYQERVNSENMLILAMKQKKFYWLIEIIMLGYNPFTIS